MEPPDHAGAFWPAHAVDYSASSRRILILASYGNDAELTAAFLAGAGMESVRCKDARELCDQAGRGCGAWLIAEETLNEHTIVLLRDWLATQPSWSEIPVVLVTGGDEMSHEQRHRFSMLMGVGNVSILERPFRKSTLVSTMEMALRSRMRQYQVRQLVEQVRRDAETLRDAARRKDEFLAMLAHELRNPLSSISNATRLLNEEGEAEEKIWATGVISRQAGQLARLVDDLLDVSRITTGKIELRQRVFDCAPILDSACETVAQLMQGRGHALHTSFQKEEIWLEADPVRVEQIVVNLLSNAAKYTKPNGHIWLDACRDGNDVVIRVRDTGMGMAPDRINDMFELFTQGERAAVRSEGGLGLGLTIVKRLCELHGGSVTAASDGVDKGSAFTVRLPAASQESIASLCSSNEPPVMRTPSGSARILIVDDNVESAGGLQRLLRRRGYAIDVAHNGLAALELASVFKPHAVLLDIGLPDMDGYEVARLLRSGNACAFSLLIALTGYGQEEDRVRARASGFDDHFVKPVDFGELLALLREKLA